MKNSNIMQLTQEENVFLAKRHAVDVIYSIAIIEKLNITFIQTQMIIDNCKIYGMIPETVAKIVNLRNAWYYMLRTINNPIDLEFICTINSFITNGIGVRLKKNKIEQIQKKLEKKDAFKKIADFLACFIPKRPFCYGNKTIYFIIANKILINDGFGLCFIPENKILDFSKKVLNNKNLLKKFIEKNCFTYMDFIPSRYLS